MSKTRLLVLFLLLSTHALLPPASFGAFDSAEANKPKVLEILRVTPEGKDVPAGRQIVFQFNQPVVPVGKMDRTAAEIPITITPATQCEWRWLNTSALACELNEKNTLKLATRYQITVNPGIMTENKETLKAALNYEFITQRPTVGYTRFSQWHGPSSPEVRVSFNQPVTRDSVEKHLFFQRANGQRVAVTLKVTNDQAENEGEEGEQAAPAKKPAENASLPEFANAWLISPKSPLPAASSAQLMVETGLVSTLGTETGIEDRTLLSLETFPNEFKFLGISCTSLKGEPVKITPKDKLAQQTRCNPLHQIALLFSSPVNAKALKKAFGLIPDLAGGRTDYDPWERITGSEYSRLREEYTKDKEYYIGLPELLKGYQNYQLKVNAKDLQDEFGRTLENNVAMQFATDHRPPNLVFEHENSVLEKNVDSELPIYVTNLNKLNLEYRLFTPQGWLGIQNKEVKLQKLQDIAYKIPLGVRQLLPTKSGIVQGCIRSTPELNNNNGNCWGDTSNNTHFFSQITPFGVQAKVGHHNSLIWVTDLATGAPVAGVDVSVYTDSYLPGNPAVAPLATAVTDSNGVAMLPGTHSLDPQLGFLQSYGRNAQHLFVRCQKGEDIALLPLNNDFQVNLYELGQSYSFYPQLQKQYGHIHTWGMTAQGVYKVGDTIQYKLFVRDQSNQAFVLPPDSAYQLSVVDPTGKTVHEIKDMKLSEFGTFAGEFQTAQNAPVGWYHFNLKANFTQEQWSPIRVLVSDFTPSPFRVRTTLNHELFHLGDTVKVDTTANLHAGGPYINAQAQVTATMMQQDFTPSNPVAKDFAFDVTVVDKHHDDTVFHTEAQIDDKGQLQTQFVLPDSPVLFGKLTVESSVRDERGKDVANSVTANYAGRDRLVGLRQTTWTLEVGKTEKVELIVVDDQGNPAKDTPIKVTIEQQQTKASRVKGAGNAYLTRYEHEWIAAGTCEVTSTLTPVSCNVSATQPGAYRMTAKITDSKGRAHQTQIQQWAMGRGHVVWETAPGYGLEIIPEQESYKVGDKARYLVKNPYPGAKALITVERFGVLKNWITTLTNSMEVIEVPVEPDFIPGFFVSVVVMSPRVEQPIDENQVDLGKPAFRMGYVKTEVKDPYKELTVEIKSDKPVYKPREAVTLDFQVKTRQNSAPTQALELAVAVLDESVFDLITGGRDYFDPYKGFYTLDELDMANYNLIMRLVGRQKFEKKGATAGGDGGSSLAMRSNFKFVSYWNPSIKADKDGKAQIKFNVPDNLTGWRVLVLAVTPNDLMGLGEGNFKVNQPIELRGVLPNQVTTGDQFQAGFNIMNRTDKVRDIKVEVQAKGSVVLAAGKTEVLHSETLKAEPFKRYNVWLPLTASSNAGKVELTATASDAEERDGLKQTVPVRARRALETAATYGTTVEKEITESLLFPKDIHPDVGGISVVATPTVIGNVEGAFKYMRDYPYMCWEQKLSKGTMASHYKNLKAYLSGDIVWNGSDTLSQETLDLAANYQAPNGGMAYFLPTEERVSPYLSAYTALAFNWLRDSGYKIPDAVENKLHDYLLSMLRRNVMPDSYSKGMASSVRAVALAALAKPGQITRDDIKRYQSHVVNMDLFGKAHYLEAALRIPATEAIRTEVAKQILSQVNITSGKVSFNETLDDGFSSLLSSQLRSQCVVLKSLVLYDEVMKDNLVSDLPFKLVNHITMTRKGRTHWENTQENMFCMQALHEFARVYEKDKPAMTVTAWLDMEKLGQAQFNDVKDTPKAFTHNMTANDVGRKASVKLDKEGQGRVYYTVRMSYALKEEKATAVNSGMDVQREYHVERDGKWELLKSPMELKTGELVRVDLYVSLPAARNFVVIDDPVPGGLEPVNRDLATSSKVAADKAKEDFAGGSLWFRFSDWHEYAFSLWSFYHKELRHHAVIYYSDYLAPGNYHLSYVAQAISAGEFVVMPTHSEEMYSPEVYGNSAPAVLKVVRDSATSK